MRILFAALLLFVLGASAPARAVDAILGLEGGSSAEALADNRISSYLDPGLLRRLAKEFDGSKPCRAVGGRFLVLVFFGEGPGDGPPTGVLVAADAKTHGVAAYALETGIDSASSASPEWRVAFGSTPPADIRKELISWSSWAKAKIGGPARAADRPAPH